MTETAGGHEHRSRWPIVAAAGAGLLYAGFAALALAIDTPYLPALVGGVAALVGAIGLVAGLFGWLDEAFLGKRVTGAAKPLYRNTMLMFLLTDVATFGAGFAYYFYIRAGQWPPAHLPEGLLGVLVLANTAILLASSGTFHYAAAALEEGNHERFTRLMAATLALGVVFLGGQVYEYYEFVVHHGFTLTTGVFASAFYGLTGLHGLHVSLGVVLLGIVTVRAWRGQYGPHADTSVETVELYWHFVDLVWVFLVLVLYVGGTLAVEFNLGG